MVKMGFIIALLGGIMACGPWTCDRFAIPKIFMLALGTMLLWGGLLAQALRGSVRPRPVWLDCIFTPIAVVLSLGLVLSIDRPLSLFGPYLTPTLGIFQILLLMVFAYGVAWGAHEMPEDDVFLALSITALVLAGFACLERCGVIAATFTTFYTESNLPRTSSLIGNPIFLSTTLAALLPASLHQAQREGWRRWLAYGGVSLSLIALYYTRSRGGVLAFACAGSVWAGLHYGVSAKKWAIAGVVGAILLVVAAAGFWKPQSDSRRVQIWSIAAKSWQQSPLFGSGPATFLLKFRKNKTDEYVKLAGTSARVHTFAHNDFLQIASDLGSIGLGAYACVLLLIFLLVRNAVAGDPSTGAVIGASLAAVFLVVKFNPISLPELLVVFSMIGVGARQAGTLWPQTQRRASTFAGAAFLVSGLLFCLASQRVIADRQHLLGIQLTNSGKLEEGSGAFEQASALVPWEIVYSQRYIVSLFPMPAWAKNRDEALGIIGRMLNASQESIRMHPSNPDAHFTYARALGMSYLYLQNDAIRFANQAIDNAHHLAPKFEPIAQLRDDLRRGNGA